MLTRRGIRVQSAPDGLKALELLTNEGFDVIVLDMRMPGMDGLATLKAIRERDALTPVVVLTGNIDLKQVSEALKEGAAEVLLKPCPVERLVSCIENAYERKGFATEVAEKVLVPSSIPPDRNHLAKRHLLKRATASSVGHSSVHLPEELQKRAHHFELLHGLLSSPFAKPSVDQVVLEFHRKPMLFKNFGNRPGSASPAHIVSRSALKEKADVILVLTSGRNRYPPH